MRQELRSEGELISENDTLRVRLDVAEESLRAIINSEIDTLVVSSAAGPLLYTLQGLDAASSRFRGEILAQINDAVVVVDDTQCVSYLNAAAELQYSISASNVLGKTITNVFHSRWIAPEDEAVSIAALRATQKWRGENIHVKLDGCELYVESSMSVLKDVNGCQTGMLAVIRDISERKLASNAMRLSEVRYRRLFEAAQDGVLLVDPVTSKITDANPFMTHLLGYAHEQLVGKEVFEIGLLDNEGASQQMFLKLKNEHHVRYDNLPLVSKAGRHKDVEVVANLYDENGRAVIQFNIRDITERRQTEEHNKLLMAEVNHRSMNLLAVVEAVVRQTARSDDTQTFVTHLSDRIHGLAASQDLLVKSQWKGVEVAELVQAQLGHFKDLFGARVLLDGPSVRLNPAAAQGIGMALHELATNAGKYGALSNGDGRVRISWQIAAAPKSDFHMSWLEEGGPVVAPPTRSGFGQIVIKRMVEASVDGSAEIDYFASGFSWKLRASLADTLDQGRFATAAPGANG